MTTLEDFLLARFAERKELALSCTPGIWGIWGMDVLADQDGSHIAANAKPIASTYMLNESGQLRTFDAMHIAENDPTFVLAEIEAKIKIVQSHEQSTWWRWNDETDTDEEFEYCQTCALGRSCTCCLDDEDRHELRWCAVNRFLVQPYSKHPDFNPEWKLE